MPSQARRPTWPGHLAGTEQPHRSVPPPVTVEVAGGDYSAMFRRSCRPFGVHSSPASSRARTVHAGLSLGPAGSTRPRHRVLVPYTITQEVKGLCAGEPLNMPPQGYRAAFTATGAGFWPAN